MRVSRAEAQAVLEGLTLQILGGTLNAAIARPSTVRKAVAKAEAQLNRAQRRALGARGDRRFHPLAREKAVVRSRNAR